MTTDPIAGAARSTPRPSGPTRRIFAKTGRSAVAPPKRTEKRSSVIADKRTGCLHTNRNPIFRLSPTPTFVSAAGFDSCVINTNAAIEPTVSTSMTAYDHAGPTNPYSRPPIAGPRIAENCQVVERHATALG